jgi:drug/metabolite transporter (DMT)-like permease
LIGNVLIFFSVLGSAFYNTYSKKVLETYSPLQVLLYRYYALLVVLLPLTVAVEPSGFTNLAHYSRTVWVGLAILAIFQYCLPVDFFECADAAGRHASGAVNLFDSVFWGADCGSSAA